MKFIKNFASSVILVLATAYFGGYFTKLGINSWYDSYPKPSLTPHNHIFPLVWSFIYVLMIFSYFIVLQKNASRKTKVLFVTQLFLQIVWCFVFFAQQHFILGFLTILLLDIVVFRMIRDFRKISFTAAYLLYPYFIWLCFASFLNFNFIKFS